MIVDPEDMINITINEKKFMINQKFADRLITANVGKLFTDVHRYTIGENVPEERLKDMVRLWNDFKPDGPIETQQLLLEFIDKYSSDPLTEILSLVNDTEVTIVFNYFRTGPFGQKYDETDLSNSCDAALESIDHHNWPDYIGFYKYTERVLEPRETQEFIHLDLIVPDDRILDGRKICNLNYFRRSVHNLLSTIQVMNIHLFVEECGPVFSERLFAYSNFDLASWPAKEMHESFVEDTLTVSKPTAKRVGKNYVSKKCIVKEEVENEDIDDEEEDI